MRGTLAVLAALLLAVGCTTAALSKTSVGEIQALLVWLIAAVLIGVAALLGPIERSAELLEKLLREASPPPPAKPTSPAPPRSAWQNFRDWL